ncbi:hypothetical protein EDM27_16930, partial [Staphylococcus aureus]
AAPTAGLHFTDELLDEIRAKGINIAFITLHVGLGTFRPVSVEDINDHECIVNIIKAAPTAGLHFTDELLDEIRAKGINIAFITLHVG